MSAKFFKGQPKDPTKERTKKMVPIAHTATKLIVEAHLPTGEHQDMDMKQYDAVATSVLQLMLDNDVKYSDKDFLFQLILQPFDLIKETVLLSLKKNLDVAIDRALGKDFRELTLGDMDKVLKNTAK